MIKGDDCVITEASTAEEGLAKAKETKFDLIISALDLPDKKGFDLIYEIKEDDALKAIPLAGPYVTQASLRRRGRIRMQSGSRRTTILKDVRSAERLG